MSVSIRLLIEADIEGVAQLSHDAWKEVRQSFDQILGTAIYHIIWPTSQREEVEAVCRGLAGNDDISAWVAEAAGEVVGFTVVKLNRSDKSGEIEYLAVSPAHQGRGIGAALNRHALHYMKAEGMRLAVVGTGGDDAHAAARRSYEKAGFTMLPLARGYLLLTDESASAL